MSEKLKQIQDELSHLDGVLEKLQVDGFGGSIVTLQQNISNLLRQRNAEEQRINKENQQAAEDTLKAEAAQAEDEKRIADSRADTEDIPPQ